MVKKKYNLDGSPRAVMGRPVTPIDWDKVATLAAIYCPAEEICAVMDFTQDTLNRACKRKFKKTYAEWSAEKRGTGRAALRNMQMAAAKKGNITMMIWLGKQLLGQSDKSDLKVSGDENAPLTLHLQAIQTMLPEKRLEEIKRLRQLREACHDE